MCRVANQQPRLPRATSSLALNACRDGASTPPWATCSVHHHPLGEKLPPHIQPKPPLSQFKTIPPCPITIHPRGYGTAYVSVNVHRSVCTQSSSCLLLKQAVLTITLQHSCFQCLHPTALWSRHPPSLLCSMLYVVSHRCDLCEHRAGLSLLSVQCR